MKISNGVKIVFLGTPEFGAIILERLIKAGYKPVLVITAPDKPVGRKQVLTPSLVKVIAEKYKIPVLQPQAILNLKSEILNLKPDLIVLVAYGQILPKEILDITQYGCLNIHPSLLPKYRGPSPIQYTILNGDKETGITIILMDEKMDHGKIISNIKYQISKRITYPELLKELAELGAKLLIEIIPKWIKGEIKPKPQDESKATFTKILNKEDVKIDWRKSALKIERQIRAFEIWPGTWTVWQKDKPREQRLQPSRHPARKKTYRIKVLKARVLKKSTSGVDYPIGKTLVAPQNELCVQCREGFLIIERLQIEGGKEMASEEFLRGHPDFIGTIFK